MSKRAKVFYGDRLAGILSEEDHGYLFLYDNQYLNSEGAQPISLTMPLSIQSYQNKTLFPFFDGLIPEGWLLNLASVHWKVSPDDRFDLLLLTCKDAIGAVSIQPENDDQ